jgi:hypothetical protein
VVIEGGHELFPNKRKERVGETTAAIKRWRLVLISSTQLGFAIRFNEMRVDEA